MPEPNIFNFLPSHQNSCQDFQKTMKETTSGVENHYNNPLCLKSLNHISIVCRSVEASIDFYQNVLGFFPVRRPGSFNFHGAWLFNYGIGIHLLKSDQEPPDKLINVSRTINPKDNHISFQCENMGIVERKLEEMKMDYVKSRVEEKGISVDQLFFHDPDGSMIEICNCEALPVIPLDSSCSRDHRPAMSMIRSCSSLNCSFDQQQQQQINSIM